MWENILKKDSDLTDDQQKKLKEIAKEIGEAFNSIDLPVLSVLMTGTLSASQKDLMAMMEKRMKAAMKAGMIKKEYRESESLYDDFYEYLEQLNGLVDNMKFNTKRGKGDLVNKEEMEKVVRQMASVYNTLNDYY